MTGSSKVLAYIHETAASTVTARIPMDVRIGPWAESVKPIPIS